MFVLLLVVVSTTVGKSSVLVRLRSAHWLLGSHGTVEQDHGGHFAAGDKRDRE
jgi:hypothetical protein